MIVLFSLFIIQFSIACACLAVDDATQVLNVEVFCKSCIYHLYFSSRSAWLKLAGTSLAMIPGRMCRQHSNAAALRTIPLKFYPALRYGWCFSLFAALFDFIFYCQECGGADKCPSCFDTLHSVINNGFRATGGIGLFFSFTEVGYC